MKSAPKVAGNPPFILDKDTPFNVWKTVVNNEFKSFGYEFLLDNEIPKPPLSEDENAKRTGFAISYLLSRLDDNYRKVVCQLKTPVEILNKIENIKNPTMSSSKFATKRTWNSANFDKNHENAVDFIIRFDDLKTKVEAFGEPLAEREVVENFLMAIDNSYPELIRKYDASGEKLSLEELKSLLINEEGREKETQERANEGQALNTDVKKKKVESSSRNKNIVCYKCGKPNHFSKECKNSKQVCYNCRELTDDHDAATCPKPAYRGRNKVGYRGGRGRAAYIRGQRGAFRGVNKIRGRGIFKPRVRGGAQGYFKERSDTKYQKMKMTDPQGK